MKFVLDNGWTVKIAGPNPVLGHLVKYTDEMTAQAILRVYMPPLTAPDQVLILNWEIFPEREYRIWKERVEEEEKAKKDKRKSVRKSRTLEFIESLHPTQYAVGMTFDRKRRYVVAIFDRVVIAESTAYGNAVYVTKREGWEDNLSRSKTYCLRRGGRRIIHSDGWERRLRMTIASLLADN